MTNTPDGVVKLEIDHAKPSDCGAYKLLISNPNGESAGLCAVAVKRKSYLFQPFTLVVWSIVHFVLSHFTAEPMKPAFIKPLRDLTVKIGEPISLEAQVTAFPSPEIKWFKDGTQLRPSQAFNFVNQPGGLIGLK